MRLCLKVMFFLYQRCNIVANSSVFFRMTEMELVLFEKFQLV